MSETRSSSAPGPPSHLIYAACCLVFFASIMFIHNHNSMAYVHSTIQYTLDAPAGWLQSTRTTVRAVTFKHGAGKAVTRAALTATTTTTTVAAAASSKTQQQQQQLAGSARVLKPRFARRYVLGHFVQQHNTAHAAELPISTTTTTTAAAGRDTATTLGEPERDIELHPQRVAQVVQRAKAAEALQQLSEQGTLPQPITAADKHAGLYDAGAAGSVVFRAQPELNSCPEGSASPNGATALVLLADSSSGAAVLKRSLDGLLLLYSQASAEIRAAFHLYIGLGGGDKDMQQLAQQYALDSLGALKLVHHSGSSSSTSNSVHDQHQSHNNSSHSSSSQDVPVRVVSGGAHSKNTNSSSSSQSADQVRLMLHLMVNCLKYPSVLLLEDDWKLLPDFLQFFHATRPLLTSDPSIFCIGAWNPIGHQHQHNHKQPWWQQLQRTDVNPGRGWLLGRRTALQLLDSWSQEKRGVTDWQQHLQQMGLLSGRQCVVPDLPRMQPAALHDTAEHAHIVALTLEALPQDADRTKAAAEGAAAGTAAVTPHAGDSVSTAEAVDRQQAPQSLWPLQEFLQLLGRNYKQLMHQRLTAAQAVDAAAAARLTHTSTAACVVYSTADELSAAADALGVSLTLTHGVRYCYMLPTHPQTQQHCQEYLPDLAYDGVVAVRNQHGARVYLVASAYWTALAGRHSTARGSP